MQSENLKFSEDVVNMKYTLIIKKANKKLNGNLICRAMNKKGSDQSSLFLKIIGKKWL